MIDKEFEDAKERLISFEEDCDLFNLDCQGHIMEINKEALDKDYKRELIKERLSKAGFGIQNGDITLSELKEYLYTIFVENKYKPQPMSDNEKEFWKNYYTDGFKYAPFIPDSVKNHIPSGTKLISWDKYIKLHDNAKNE